MNRIFITLLSLLLVALSSVAQSPNLSATSSALFSNNAQPLYIIEPIKHDVAWQQWVIIQQMKSRNQYIVKVLDLNRLRQTNYQSLRPYTADEKYDLVQLENATKEGAYYSLYVKPTRQVNKNDLINKIKNAGGIVSNDHKAHKAGWIGIKAKLVHVPAIAALEDVLYIGHNAIDVALNKEAVAITNAYQLQEGYPSLADTLLGSGVVIGVGDDGDPSHVDINDRLVQNFSHAVGSGHGVHTTVTTGGAGIKDELYKGFAPRATLLGQFFSGVLFFGADMYQDFDMRITNNSYANGKPQCSNFGYYNHYSEFLDSQCVQYPNLLHVFAAGNYATYTCDSFPQGYGTVASSYQSAKNPLVVGNLGKHTFQYNSTTSRGPTRDGRLKPEIMAQGMQVISGGKDDTYYSNTGTSMAAPNVAGTAALLVEQYKKTHAGTEPQADILKAILMNGARDIYQPHPDYISGFGLMNAVQSVDMITQYRIIVDSIAHGELINYSVMIPPNVSKLKVMLYWADMPVAPNPDTALINDLDLKVNRGALSFQPWVLNPDSPTAIAVRGIDRLNNVEQVTLDEPGSGDFSLVVTGHSVTGGKQRFVLVYDCELDDMKVTYPLAHTNIVSGTPFYTYFEKPSGANQFTISLSTDGGSSYTVLTTSNDINHRHFFLENTDTINSTKCLIKVVENGTGLTAVSDTFAIIPRPVISLKTLQTQCPGSIAVEWNAIASATDYVLFRNIGGEMIAIDTVASSVLQYTFAGLPQDTIQWVAVAPIIQNRLGIRSEAISRLPYDGDCNDTRLPTYDLTLKAIISPNSGRQYTSQELTSAESVRLLVQNTGKNTITQARVGLYNNGSSLGMEDITLSLAPGEDTVLNTGFTLDLSAINQYELKAFLVSNSNNLVRNNDTVIKVIKHIANPPFDKALGYNEGFENVAKLVIADTFHLGVNGANAWDYSKDKGYGRLKSFVMSSNNIEGSKSMTMDLSKNVRNLPDSQSTNQLIFTSNLSAVDIYVDELRADFLYRYAGTPKYSQENAIYLRGKDTDEWIRVTSIDTAGITNIHRLDAVSINDYLLANGQNFSTSTQLMIQQKDTALIVGYDYGNGLTIDDFRMYHITKDVAVERIVNPTANPCDINATERISVSLRNNVFNTIYDIPVHYQIDNGMIRTEIIDSIPAKSSITHTFATVENFTKDTAYTISTWSSWSDDEYKTNDSVMNIIVFKAPSITTFPYFNSFEDSNNHDFYVKEINSSWTRDTQYTFMAKGGINGKHFWHTESIEQSDKTWNNFLYSRCLDLSSMSQPRLSFSVAARFQEDAEDALAYALVEYCVNGVDWIPLVQEPTAYNWYDDAWSRGKMVWQMATHDLPKSDNVIIRFVMRNRVGDKYYSLAIDDIHIYDKSDSIFQEKGSLTQSRSVNASTPVPFVNNGHILGVINSTQALGMTSISQYNHDPIQLNQAMEYILPTSFVLLGVGNSTARKDVQLFIPHQSFVDLRSDTLCLVCNKLSTVYDVGVSNYYGPSQSWDGQLSNNLTNDYTFIPNKEVSIIPYENGYIVRFSTDRMGEYWFNDGGYRKDAPVNFVPVALQGRQVTNDAVLLHFDSYINDLVSGYFLQKKDSVGQFFTFTDFTPTDKTSDSYSFLDYLDSIPDELTYRLVYQLKNGLYKYTNEIHLQWNDMGSFTIHPNPVTNGSLEISYSLSEVLPVHATIVDQGGKVVFHTQVPITDTRGHFVIDITRMGIAKGSYYIRLESGKHKEVHKFIYLK